MRLLDLLAVVVVAPADRGGEKGGIVSGPTDFPAAPPADIRAFTGEELAEFAHILMSKQAVDMFDVGYQTDKGQLVIPPVTVRRVKVQMLEPYAELKPGVKAGLRAEVAGCLKEMGR